MREQALQRASVAVGTLLALLLGEALLRVAGALSPESAGDLARTGEAVAPPVTGDCHRQAEQASLAGIVRPSAVPDLIYELKPGIDTCFARARVRINGEGLRAGASIRRPKPPGVFRILLLGDSQTFGWGLDDADTLGARLASELRRPDAPEVEVVNAGVPGYNTGQEAAFLRARGLDQEPDCVMVLFIDNDLGLPPFLLRPTSALMASRSLLLSRLARFFASGTRAEAASPWWEWTAFEDQGLRLLDGARPQVPPEYAHLVGVAGYRRALRSIAEAARERRIPVVNVADYGPPGVDWAAIEREQAELGIVHATPRFAWHSPELSLEGDPHLAPHGVAELARRVAGELRKRDVCLPPS
jgi:lysophospholipase L1-like esterase